MKKRKSILWHINGIIRSDVQKGIKEKKELNGPNFSILPLSFFFFLTMAGWPNRSGRLERNWLDSSFFPAPCVCMCVHGTNHSDGNSRQIFAWAGMRRWWNTIHDGLASCVWTHTQSGIFSPNPKVSQDFSFVSHSGLENSIIAPAMHILKKLLGRLFLVSTAVQKCPVSPKETYLFFLLSP